MEKILKINNILIAIIIGLTIAGITFAFTGPPSGIPPAGNPYFWQLNDTKMYYSTDNIGIGTNNPLSKLDVNGGVAVGSYAGTNAAPSNGLIVSGSVGIGTASPTTAGLVVATNVSGASIDAGSNRIINVATPTSTTDAVNKSYVDSSAITWAGYTSAQTGNLGGLKGANTLCNSAYSGSHWASVDEIERLGSSYPWTDSVWVRGAINANADFYRGITVGYCEYSVYKARQYLPYLNNINCSGWVSGSQTIDYSNSMAGYNGCQGYSYAYYRDDYLNSNLYQTGYLYGTIISSAGYLDYAVCNGSYKIACVR
jgi:hypothetical protein